MSELRTDFKDEILQEGEEHRIYNIKRKDTNEEVESNIYLEKAYTPLQEGDNFGAKEVNEIHGRLNGLAPQNLLINGDFKIWQRGDAFTIRGNGGKSYTADMWEIRNQRESSAQVTHQKTDNGKGTGFGFPNLNSMRIYQWIPIEEMRQYDGQYMTRVWSVNKQVHSETFLLNLSASDDTIEGDKWRAFYLLSKSDDVLNYAALYPGKIVYPHVPEDIGTALTRCLQYIKRYIANGNVIYHYLTTKRYLIDVPLDEMAGTPTLSDIVVKWYSDSGRWITGNVIEALQVNRLVTFYVSYDGLLPINQYSLTTECVFTASCEPL